MVARPLMQQPTEEQNAKIVVVASDILEIFEAHDLDGDMRVSVLITALASEISAYHPREHERAYASIDAALRHIVPQFTAMDE